MMGVWILLSFVAGALFGTVVMAICQVSKIEEDKRRNI